MTNGMTPGERSVLFSERNHSTQADLVKGGDARGKPFVHESSLALHA
jgi:hypothetical protein